MDELNVETREPVEYPMCGEVHDECQSQQGEALERFVHPPSHLGAYDSMFG